MVRVNIAKYSSKETICQNSDKKSLDSEGHLYSGSEISDLMISEKSKKWVPPFVLRAIYSI